MSRRLLVLLSLSLPVLGPVGSTARSATILVPGDQPTIQAALDAAADGDVIELADGTFSGDGNRDLDGGGREVTIRSASGDPAITTIDAGGSLADPHRVFLFESGEGADFIVEGVTLTGGHVVGLPDPSGGGVFCAGASPTFRHCIFRANRAYLGAGLHAEDGSPTFEDCEFVANVAEDEAGWGFGAGLHLGTGFASAIRRCVFRDNVAGDPAEQGAGAGVQGYGWEGAVIEDCVFEDNTARSVAGISLSTASTVVRIEGCEFRRNRVSVGAPGGGGASIRTFRCPIEVVDCWFEDNSGYHAGGLFLSDAECLVRGCTFVDNVAQINGGACYVNQDAVTTFEDCEFRGNEAQGTFTSHGGGAVYQGTATDTRFVRCLFVENVAPHGAAFRRYSGQFRFENCTIVGQHGAAIAYGSSFGGTIDRTIIAFTEEGAAIECGVPDPTVTCSNLFGNAGGPGPCDFSGNQNFTADPRFCDVEGGDFSLRADSPCAPPGLTGCGLVGALPVTCGSVSIESRSWGHIKARYRGDR